MQIKCEYCGSMIPDDAPVCPNCGAPNENMRRSADGTPKTIEELQQWYRARNLPPYEVTRFFIGEDYQGPRAIGIYKKGEKYIVYKNKSDGTRVIRYEGTDEDYAVNEVYLKLKAEILNQKEHQTPKNTYNYNSSAGNNGNRGPNFNWKRIIIIAVIIFVVGTMIYGQCGTSSVISSVPFIGGFYNTHNNDYGNDYYDNDSYNSNNNYYNNDSYNSYDSNDSYDSWDSDWDNDYDWDSNDSWDSWDSDWDSDW